MKDVRHGNMQSRMIDLAKEPSIIRAAVAENALSSNLVTSGNILSVGKTQRLIAVSEADSCV